MIADERRFGLDSTVLVNAVDANGGEKTQRAEQIVRRAAASRRGVLALQSIGEFYHACTRKRYALPEAAARRARDYARLFPIIEPRLDDARFALDEAAAGRFSYWDALLLATLGRAGCAVLLSEGMRDGVVLAGTTVRDPFRDEVLPGDVQALLA